MTGKLGSLLFSTAIVTAAGVASAQLDADANMGASAEVGGQAQEQAAPPPEVAPAAPAPAPAAEPAPNQGQVGMALPQQAPPEDQGESDHEMMVGRIAVGYLGLRGLQLPTGGATPTNMTTEEVLAPVVGVRFWMNPMVGLDLGLGFMAMFGSDTTKPVGGSSTSVDSPLPTVLIAHAGVPLSLVSKDHFSFQIVPELNVGYGWRTVVTAADDIDQSDFHLDIGARAGAEVQFGFMGIPELSLQGGIGLLIATDQSDVSSGGASIKQSRTSIGTNVGASPWNIFISNVAALYYF